MDDDRVAAAEAVAERWAEQGVPYLVLHGLERYPAGLGRDLDILMTARAAESALPEAATVLQGLGWDVALPPRLWGRRLVALKAGTPGERLYLELHTMTSLRWAALTLVDDRQGPDGRVGPFPVNRWATFAKTILTPLLALDLARFQPDYLAHLHMSAADAERIRARLTQFFGHDLANEVLAGYAGKDEQWLRRLSHRLRRASLRHFLTHPVASAGALPRFIAQKVGRLTSVSGIRARIRVPGGAEPGSLDRLIASARRLFVTVDAGKPEGLVRMLEQQYRTLSRQGLVLDLEASPDDAWGAVVVEGKPFGLPGKALETFQPRDGDPPTRIADWLIDRWATTYAFEPSPKRRAAALERERS